MTYLTTIKTAIIFFPIIALLITIPYFIWQYHKVGRIHFGKMLCSYSFVLYCMCIYFLVVLPLPSIESVRNLTTPYAQLIPFTCIRDIIKNCGFVIQDPGTWFGAFTCFDTLQVVFNFIMMVPFGIYLRYLFRLNKKETMLFSFIATLFFELTQLTGLYGIYPRPYRLFDVDDLIINFLGSMFGYAILPVFKFMPSMDEIEYKAYKKIDRVTFLRRLAGLFIDGLVVICLEALVDIVFGRMGWFRTNASLVFLLVPIVYFIVALKVSNGYTIGKHFVGIRVKNDNGEKIKIWQIIVRLLMLFVLYLAIPIVLTLFIGLFSLIIISVFNTDFLNQTVSIFGVDLSYSMILIGVLFVLFELMYFYIIGSGKRNKNGYKLLQDKLSKTTEINALKYKNKNKNIKDEIEKDNTEAEKELEAEEKKENEWNVITDDKLLMEEEKEKTKKNDEKEDTLEKNKKEKVEK